MQKEIGSTGVDATKAEVGELIQTLVSGNVTPSRILELYYWSLEPGALEMLRNFLSLPKDDRALLQAFLGSADPQSISIEAAGPERLVPTSSEIASSRPVVREQRHCGGRDLG
jgi:hypothetical protein